MNKRISTLMASVLLAGAFSANAADNLKVGDFVRLICTNAVGINIGANGLPDGCLKGVSASITISETEEANIHKQIQAAQAQIWKVAKVTTLASGQKCYQFTNKLTNEYLAADLSLATETGTEVKLSAQGNKDWYATSNGQLYIYNSSKDSVYALNIANNKVLLKRTQGTTVSSTSFDLNTQNPEVNIMEAPVFNALMSYKGNDGKLHFNGNNVSDGYTNILVDTKWNAIFADKTNGSETFFLANGKETSDNKNPYLLMVDHQSYTNNDDNFALTTDTLAVDKDDAKKVADGNYNATQIGDYFKFRDGQKIETFARPIGAAQWTATYSLLNDSLSLKPVKLPAKTAATAAYVSDGFTIVKVGAEDKIENAALSGVRGQGTNVLNSTGEAVANVKKAVGAWLGRLASNLTASKGFQLTFKESFFTVADLSKISTEEAPVDGTDITGEKLIALAKTALAGVADADEAQMKLANEFLEAAGYLKAFTTAAPDKYFERGVAHQAGEPNSAKSVALVKLLDKNVLTLAEKTASNFVETLIQPYVSAPTGDAEITADAKLFFIQVKNTDQKFLRATSETDKYVVSYEAGRKELVDYVDNANPNAQWVFIPNAAGSYSIINRATEYPLYSGMVQKVKDAAGNVVADTYVIGTDTLKLGAVTLSTDAVYEEKDGDDKVKYDYAGYFYAGPQDGKTMTFGIAPVSPFMSTLAMQVKADSTVVLGDAENAPVWYFDQVTGKAYGVKIAGLPRLKSVAYKVYIKDADGKKYYVVPDATTNTFVITKEDSQVGNTYKNSTTAGLFFRTVAKDMYLISNGTENADYKMTINSTPEQPIIEATKNENKLKNDYFTVGKATANIYRTLTAEDGVNGNAKIYMQYEPNRFLYENTANIVANNGNKVAKDSLNFLGIFHAMEMDKNAALYIDTAYVEREGNIMPQYMLAVGVEDVEAHAVIPCTEAGVHIDKDGKPTTADKCVHATAATKGYKSGRYLVFVDDSIPAGVTKHPALYDGAKRFAFVPAKHYLGEDSLVIDNSKWTGNTNVLEAGKSKTYASKDTIKLSDNLTKATFALKFKDQESKSFYLETKGGYVRILNGVPVLGDEANAAVFNIAATEEEATANEAIEATGVQVIGGKGAVTVQGAAGKVITVANILGQTIANQVAASDNVTIAAPAGIVVVAVEGEATKVVVE